MPSYDTLRSAGEAGMARTKRARKVLVHAPCPVMVGFYMVSENENRKLETRVLMKKLMCKEINPQKVGYHS